MIGPIITHWSPVGHENPGMLADAPEAKNAMVSRIDSVLILYQRGLRIYSWMPCQQAAFYSVHAIYICFCNVSLPADSNLINRSGATTSVKQIRDKGHSFKRLDAVVGIVIPMAKNASNNVAGFALQFVGSLFFLAAVAALYVPWGSGQYSTWPAGATLWVPILYAVAVVSAIALFFTSFAQLGSMGGMASWKAMSTTSAAAVTLVALTAGNTTWFVAVLIGFVLSFLGSAVGMMGMKSMRR